MSAARLASLTISNAASRASAGPADPDRVIASMPRICYGRPDWLLDFVRQ